MADRKIEQIREIVSGIAEPDEIAEVDRVVGEAKGRILMESKRGFWAGKTPCWEMVRCPEAIKNDCPASKGHSVACWEIAGTYCKLPSGHDTSICEVCRVYKRWGDGEVIAIKLDTTGTTGSAAAETRTKAASAKAKGGK
ncbi:MAG: hypothetical protein FJ020_00985 [Chloroflexi bacterium]|nr:hypothetical protein [Chloroflexota bacterium]